MESWEFLVFPFFILMKLTHRSPLIGKVHNLEKEMATHSSVLAWRIPGTREPGGYQQVGNGASKQAGI